MHCTLLETIYFRENELIKNVYIHCKIPLLGSKELKLNNVINWFNNELFPKKTKEVHLTWDLEAQFTKRELSPHSFLCEGLTEPPQCICIGNGPSSLPGISNYFKRLDPDRFPRACTHCISDLAYVTWMYVWYIRMYDSYTRGR